MAEVLAGTAGVREVLQGLLRSARERGDASEAGRAATVMLLHTLADFADFRGLGEALAAFDAAPVGPLERLRVDAVLLGRPSLDHRHDHGDPALVGVRRRLFEALRAGGALGPDERLLLAKVLVDHDSMRNDLAACNRVLALMQDVVPNASLRWQATWWRLAAEVHDYTGHTALARAANGQLQALLARLDWPEGTLAMACEEMRQALHVDDLPRAERAFLLIERQRPRVRPALLPRGLRSQVGLLLRRREFDAALERSRLMLELSEDHEVPARDRAGYLEQQAHALSGLGRHAEAVALLESLRPTQVGGQAEVLEAIIAMARAVQGLETGAPDAQACALEAVRRAAAVRFHRFLMSFPGWAARIAMIGLDAGVETEFLAHAVRERRLQPPEPQRERWPWWLQVYALGELRVLRDGALLVGAGGKAQKKPLELLAVLAAQGGRSIDSEALIDQLWPSLEANAPKASLEMAVSRLRKLLDLPDAIQVEGGSVRLNPALVWTDVGAFELAADAAGRADEAAAERAVALYRDRLLGSDEPRGLMAAARERLALRFARVLVDQGARLEQRGDWTGACRLYERGLLQEPLAEPIYRALMRAHLHLGERAEALRTYRRCSELLRSVLGVSPSAETAALHRAAAGPH